MQGLSRPVLVVMVIALPYIVLVALYILQIERKGVLSRVGFIYIADAMRGQVDLAILLVGQLVLSAGLSSALCILNERVKR